MLEGMIGSLGQRSGDGSVLRCRGHRDGQIVYSTLLRYVPVCYTCELPTPQLTSFFTSPHFTATFTSREPECDSAAGSEAKTDLFGVAIKYLLQSNLIQH